MAYEIKPKNVLDNTDVAVGIKLPMVSTSGKLFDLSYTNQDQAISNLKNLILTRPGERVFQPAFGTELQNALFEQNTDLLRDKVQNSITSAIEFWMPYISIYSLTIDNVIVSNSYNEEHGIQVKLQVLYNGNLVNQPLTFLITLAGVEII